MAYNQASFFLFPPRWGPLAKIDHTAKTSSGDPLKIVSSSMIDPSAPKILVTPVQQWFADRGFTEKERYTRSQILFRDSETTPFGMEKVVQLTLPTDEDEVHELYIRFLLTERTPSRISEWRDLISELGHDFGFRIMDENQRLLPCVDFMTVLAENWNFCEFQRNYGWNI